MSDDYAPEKLERLVISGKDRRVDGLYFVNVSDPIPSTLYMNYGLPRNVQRSSGGRQSESPILWLIPSYTSQKLVIAFLIALDSNKPLLVNTQLTKRSAQEWRDYLIKNGLKMELYTSIE